MIRKNMLAFALFSTFTGLTAEDNQTSVYSLTFGGFLFALLLIISTLDLAASVVVETRNQACTVLFVIANIYLVAAILLFIFPDLKILQHVRLLPGFDYLEEGWKELVSFFRKNILKQASAIFTNVVEVKQ